MRILLPAILVAASVALSGCTLGGDAAADESREPILDGPHFVLDMENLSPHEVEVRYVLDGPAGGVADGTLVVPAQGTLAEPIPIAPSGEHSLHVVYSWSAEGRAASGDQRVPLDARQCPGVFHVLFSVSKSQDGVTYSRAETTCHASA